MRAAGHSKRALQVDVKDSSTGVGRPGTSPTSASPKKKVSPLRRDSTVKPGAEISDGDMRDVRAHQNKKTVDVLVREVAKAHWRRKLAGSSFAQAGPFWHKYMFIDSNHSSFIRTSPILWDERMTAEFIADLVNINKDMFESDVHRESIFRGGKSIFRGGKLRGCIWRVQNNVEMFMDMLENPNNTKAEIVEGEYYRAVKHVHEYTSSSHHKVVRPYFCLRSIKQENDIWSSVQAAETDIFVENLDVIRPDDVSTTLEPHIGIIFAHSIPHTPAVYLVRSATFVRMQVSIIGHGKFVTGMGYTVTSASKDSDGNDIYHLQPDVENCEDADIKQQILDQPQDQQLKVKSDDPRRPKVPNLPFDKLEDKKILPSLSYPYAELFFTQHISGRDLYTLSRQALFDMGVKELGYQRLLEKHSKSLFSYTIEDEIRASIDWLQNQGIVFARDLSSASDRLWAKIYQNIDFSIARALELETRSVKRQIQNILSAGQSLNVDVALHVDDIIKIDAAVGDFTAEVSMRINWIEPTLAGLDLEQDTLLEKGLDVMDLKIGFRMCHSCEEVIDREVYLEDEMTGLVREEARFRATFSCPMNLERFPFDTQTLEIQIYSQHGSLVQFSCSPWKHADANQKNILNREQRMTTPEWHVRVPDWRSRYCDTGIVAPWVSLPRGLTNVGRTRYNRHLVDNRRKALNFIETYLIKQEWMAQYTRQWEYTPVKDPKVIFVELEAVRRPMFYNYRYFLPMMCITVLAFSIICYDVTDSEGRLHVVLTLLLAASAFNSNSNTRYLTLLDMYCLFSFCFLLLFGVHVVTVATLFDFGSEWQASYDRAFLIIIATTFFYCHGILYTDYGASFDDNQFNDQDTGRGTIWSGYGRLDPFKSFSGDPRSRSDLTPKVSQAQKMLDRSRGQTWTSKSRGELLESPPENTVMLLQGSATYLAAAVGAKDKLMLKSMLVIRVKNVIKQMIEAGEGDLTDFASALFALSILDRNSALAPAAYVLAQREFTGTTCAGQSSAASTTSRRPKYKGHGLARSASFSSPPGLGRSVSSHQLPLSHSTRSATDAGLTFQKLHTQLWTGFVISSRGLPDRDFVCAQVSPGEIKYFWVNVLRDPQNPQDHVLLESQSIFTRKHEKGDEIRKIFIKACEAIHRENAVTGDVSKLNKAETTRLTPESTERGLQSSEDVLEQLVKLMLSMDEVKWKENTPTSDSQKYEELDIVFVCTNLYSVRYMEGLCFDSHNMCRVEKRLTQAFKRYFGKEELYSHDIKLDASASALQLKKPMSQRKAQVEILHNQAIAHFEWKAASWAFEKAADEAYINRHFSQRYKNNEQDCLPQSQEPEEDQKKVDKAKKEAIKLAFPSTVMAPNTLHCKTATLTLKGEHSLNKGDMLIQSKQAHEDAAQGTVEKCTSETEGGEKFTKVELTGIIGLFDDCTTVSVDGGKGKTVASIELAAPAQDDLELVANLSWGTQTCQGSASSKKFYLERSGIDRVKELIRIFLQGRSGKYFADGENKEKPLMKFVVMEANKQVDFEPKLLNESKAHDEVFNPFQFDRKCKIIFHEKCKEEFVTVDEKFPLPGKKENMSQRVQMFDTEEAFWEERDEQDRKVNVGMYEASLAGDASMAFLWEDAYGNFERRPLCGNVVSKLRKELRIGIPDRM